MYQKNAAQACYSISKSIMSLLPSPCRATALSAARRLDTIDLEMELKTPPHYSAMNTLVRVDIIS